MEKKDNLIVIDTETTGLDPTQHQLMSVSFQHLDEDIPSLDLFVSHPNYLWTDVAKSYFKRYQSPWNEFAEPIERVQPAVREWFTAHDIPFGATLVGHNVSFDVVFLKTAMDFDPFFSYRTIDTASLLLTLHHMGKIPTKATGSSGAFDHFGINVNPRVRHTAHGDAIATRALFRKLATIISNGGNNGQASFAFSERVAIEARAD